MKILLLGEFSGFFKNLKEGFKDLGHEVVLIAGGDGWKKIDGADVSLDSNFKGIFRKADIALKYLINLRKMRGYDVVLIINSNFFKKYVGEITLNYIIKHNKKLFLSACGDDVEYISYGLKNNYRWWPFMDWCDEYRNDYYQSKREINIHRKLIRNVHGIIPTSYEYAQAWRNSSVAQKVKKTIPLPINTSNIKYIPYTKKDKIVFCHGLNRECFKGTSYIREAMLNIKKKYPDKVECIIKGRMPLNEYLDTMSKTDVVIDQCKVYCYVSMNSLYAMAQGKIVMSGMQKECYEEFGLKDSPIINIEPNAKQIEAQMEYIIRNKDKLEKWSKYTREFVEKHHDSKLIAKKYLKVFEE